MLFRFMLALALIASMACGSDNAGNQPVTLGQTVGVNTHYGWYGPVNHEALAQLANAGVSFIRNDLTWDSVENEGRGVPGRCVPSRRVPWNVEGWVELGHWRSQIFRIVTA